MKSLIFPDFSKNFKIFFPISKKYFLLELKKKVGHSFHVEKWDLSIYEVYRVFPAVLRGFWDRFPCRTNFKSRIFISEAFHVLFKVAHLAPSKNQHWGQTENHWKIDKQLTESSRIDSCVWIWIYKDTLSRVDLLDSLNSQFSRAYSFWKSASKQAKSSEKQWFWQNLQLGGAPAPPTPISAKRSTHF